MEWEGPGGAGDPSPADQPDGPVAGRDYELDDETLDSVNADDRDPEPAHV